LCQALEARRLPTDTRVKSPKKSIKHLGWWIVWMLFGSTVINYINRQTLSVLAPRIMHQLHMTSEDYSYVVSTFQLAYAGMWLVGSVIIDIIGTRLGLMLAMISLVGFQHVAFAGGLRVFARGLSLHAGHQRGFQQAGSQQDCDGVAPGG
jgi:sugar phosphate permease